jgi:hypothetical protein
MREQSQQDYLREAKARLGLEWDDFATLVGVKPRAFKTYRMPDSSGDHRGLPPLAKAAIDRILAEHDKKMRRGKKAA